MELAHGDLKDYFNFCSPTDEELYSCLFQIMAGLNIMVSIMSLPKGIFTSV